MLFDTHLIKQNDGTFFSSTHYRTVIEARKKAGLPVTNTNQDYAHPWIGKQIRDTKLDKVYNIVSCKKQWHFGWYYALLIEHDDSHGVIWQLCLEQPTCSDMILKHIKKHNERFELIEE